MKGEKRRKDVPISAIGTIKTAKAVIIWYLRTLYATENLYSSWKTQYIRRNWVKALNKCVKFAWKT
jgi:hypothetical protein